MVAQQQLIDGQAYQFTYGLTGEWAHQFDQFNRFNLGVSFGRQHYDNTDVHLLKDQSDIRQTSGALARTADYWGMSGGWTHVFGIDWQPVLNLTAGYSHEENAMNRDDFTRDVYNARAQVSLTPAPRWGVSLGTSFLQADHKANFVSIATSEPRRDHAYGIDAAVSYRIDKTWSVRGEAQWTTQDSNVGLFEYSRAAVAAKVRYEFN